MDRYGYVESKCPVVQHVDAVEQGSDVCPPRHGYTVFAALSSACSEEWSRECHDGDEGELQESDQKTCEILASD